MFERRWNHDASCPKNIGYRRNWRLPDFRGLAGSTFTKAVSRWIRPQYGNAFSKAQCCGGGCVCCFQIAAVSLWELPLELEGPARAKGKRVCAKHQINKQAKERNL